MGKPKSGRSQCVVFLDPWVWTSDVCRILPGYEYDVLFIRMGDDVDAGVSTSTRVYVETACGSRPLGVEHDGHMFPDLETIHNTNTVQLGPIYSFSVSGRPWLEPHRVW
jgi:hypothetical protein